MSKSFGIKSATSKPLEEILGPQAEKKLNLKLFDAPKYFEKPEEKEMIERQLKTAFSICK